MKYGKTELTPPSPTELPAAVAQAVGLATKAITFQWAGLTVKVSDCASPISQTRNNYLKKFKLNDQLDTFY